MDRKNRWGILGSASIAARLIAASGASEDAKFVAVASRDAGKAETFAAAYSLPLFFGSYEEMLDSGEIDFVYNPLPNHLHAIWTLEAVKRGLPVLCEKPLATSAQEAELVLNRSREAGVYVAEGFMYRHHPQIAALKKLIESGRLGELSSVSAVFTFCNDDPNANFLKADFGGGSLADVGCYCVDFCRIMAGCEPVKAAAVQAGDEVDLTLAGALSFANGVVGQVECSVVNFERRFAQVVGTKGCAALSDPWLGVGAAIELQLDDGTRETIEVGADDPYALQLNEFMAVCNNGARPKWDLSFSVANAAAMDMLKKSAASNRQNRQ